MIHIGRLCSPLLPDAGAAKWMRQRYPLLAGNRKAGDDGGSRRMDVRDDHQDALPTLGATGNTLPTDQPDGAHIIKFIDADGTVTGSLVRHHGGRQAWTDFEDATGPGLGRNQRLSTSSVSTKVHPRASNKACGSRSGF